ncbi:hypothetical protein [Ornithinimicrobium kibberense]|uniref:hypothetical protein n=1 Tax=Ornithinimicrobium kibberense TaxID=282060 RepID=UPI00361C0662
MHLRVRPRRKAPARRGASRRRRGQRFRSWYLCAVDQLVSANPAGRFPRCRRALLPSECCTDGSTGIRTIGAINGGLAKTPWRAVAAAT